MNRAISKGEPRALSNDVSSATYEECCLAALHWLCIFLPFAVLADLKLSEVMTDNRSHALAQIKELMYRNGGSFSRVLFSFMRKGLLVVKRDGRHFDKVLEEAIDLGAEDVEEAKDDSIRVETPFRSY